MNQTTTQPYRNVSRIQMLTAGQAPWSLTVISLLMVLALALFVFRHAIAWHRVLVKSEAFVVHHKLLDVAFVAILVAGVILTRTSGFIN